MKKTTFLLVAFMLWGFSFAKAQVKFDKTVFKQMTMKTADRLQWDAIENGVTLFTFSWVKVLLQDIKLSDGTTFSLFEDRRMKDVYQSAPFDKATNGKSYIIIGENNGQGMTYYYKVANSVDEARGIMSKMYMNNPKR